MEMGITLERHRVQIVGRDLLYEGEMEPLGPVLDFLNAPTRSTFPLYSVRVMPINLEGPFKGVSRPEITVDRNELGILYFFDPAFRSKVQMLRNADSVIAYTPHAILRGRFHRGAETRLRDLFDGMQGIFLPMTEVSLYPTTDLPSPLPAQTDLVILNREFVRFYHAA